MKSLLALLLLAVTLPLAAADARYTLDIRNPGRDSGIQVGEVLTRTIVLETVPPYAVLPSSLPAKGISRNGIELRGIDATRSGNRTTLQLAYQVFTSADSPKKAALPAEHLQLAGDGQTVRVTIPAWTFRISPLAANDNARIEDDMRPFYGPMLRDESRPQALLFGSAVLSALAALGLLYVNGSGRWLPGMGGPFATACRTMRRLGPDEAQKAATALHHAFNRAFGRAFFAAEIPRFLREHPRFLPIKADIEDFLRTSDQLRFAQTPPDRYTLHKLQYFGTLCRDCEREPFALPPLTAVTVSSIVLTLVIVLLMQQIAVLPIWPLVIAWACFFHLGGAEDASAAMRSVFISTVFGVLMGWLSALTIMSNPAPELLPGNLWGAGVIAIAVGVISVCAYWKTLSITPVCIYGYAATWGFLDVPGRFDWSVLTAFSWQNVMLALPVAIAVGCAFAWVNARMVGLLARTAP